ncbi:MAG TPA: hypothetical protein VF209_02835 [Patescibacteria group bacterium]
MSSYYCLLGSTPALSVWELESVVSTPITHLTSSLVKLALDSDQHAQELMKKLGGSIKIYRHISTVSDQSKLTTAIAEHLKSIQAKPRFGLAYFGLPAKEPSVQDIKDHLSQESIPSRYIESDMNGLSASIILHHKNVTEVALIKEEAAIHLAELVAIQDIDDWTTRDRHKPFFDRKKGMLPPKIARIMVNLAVSEHKKAAGDNQENQEVVTVFDPFCGTGTVLLEAALQGHNVIGSDASMESAHGTQNNLEWLAKEYDVPVNHQVFVSDASSVSQKVAANSVDIIVTEPFLGKQTPQVHQVPNIFKGLEKLYLGAFKDWQKVLKPGAVVTIIFPSVETPRHTFTLQGLIDKLPSLGYTISSGPVQYARPGAIVKRNIYTFTYVKS